MSAPADAGRPRGFLDRSARGEYGRLAAAIFLAAATNHQSVMLGVVWERAGFSTEEIGFLFAIYGAPLVILSFLSGAVANRFGLLTTSRVGAACILIGLASFAVTKDSFAGSCVSRIIQGTGFGLFMSPIMTYGMTRLTKERFVHLFSLLSSMAPLPQAIAPVLGEALLRHSGKETLFLVGALPALAALPFLWTLRAAERPESAPGDYARVLTSPVIRLPLVSNAAFGAAFGVVTAFFALILFQRELPLGAFFTTYTVVLFGSRFGLLGLFEQVDRRLIIALGLSLIGAGLALAAFATTWTSMVVAGIFFGLGHSTGFPVIATWLGEALPPETRATSLSISNAVFFASSWSVPIPAAVAIARLGYEPVLTAVTAYAWCVAIILVASWARRPVIPPPQAPE